MSKHATPTATEVPVTVIRELDLPELTYSLSPPPTARPKLSTTNSNTLVLPSRARSRPLTDAAASSLGGSATLLPAVKPPRNVTFSPVQHIIPPARYSSDRQSSEVAPLSVPDSEGPVQSSATSRSRPTPLSVSILPSPFLQRPPPSSPPPVAPLPRIPFDQHMDHIQAVIASKRLAVRSAFIRQRALESFTLALYSTLGLSLALATLLPIHYCAKDPPRALQIALPLALYAVCLLFGVSVELSRSTGRRRAVLRKDRSETRNLILNLCRLIHDISRLPKASTSRRSLMSHATKCMAETMDLLRLYDGDRRSRRDLRDVLCGPMFLLLGVSRAVHFRQCSLACCLWTFGFDRRRRFMDQLALDFEPDWGLIDLSRFSAKATQ